MLKILSSFTENDTNLMLCIWTRNLNQNNNQAKVFNRKFTAMEQIDSTIVMLEKCFPSGISLKILEMLESDIWFVLWVLETQKQILKSQWYLWLVAKYTIACWEENPSAWINKWVRAIRFFTLQGVKWEAVWRLFV